MVVPSYVGGLGYGEGEDGTIVAIIVKTGIAYHTLHCTITVTGSDAGYPRQLVMGGGYVAFGSNTL